REIPAVQIYSFRKKQDAKDLSELLRQMHDLWNNGFVRLLIMKLPLPFLILSLWPHWDNSVE
ncbi:hypothetical protein OFB83_30375, partial [Escherichia coli]|nr:hypothetical protein [Escherichia coli]